MAPLRRYLRITRYSVLEVRIYLESPSLVSTWLLNPRDPVLPRIIAAVRPLVLPKLREENERAQGGRKGAGKKKGVRDVVVEDDFEVIIFLTNLSTRHSLLTKQKAFTAKPERMRSNSGKLTGWLNSGTKDAPHMVSEANDAPAVLREEDGDENRMANIPEAGPRADEEDEGRTGSSRRQTHKRGRGNGTEDEEEALFVSSSDSETFQTQASPASRKRRKRNENLAEDGTDTEQQPAEDDKKKLALNTSYDGFSIYGKILCLVVKRKGGKAKAGPGGGTGSSQAMMENWVSTQAQQEVGIEEE